MGNIQELYGYLIGSKVRYNIMTALKKGKVMRPVEIAKETKIKPSNVSKNLYDLLKYKLVVCITPNKKTWRIYALTDIGKEVLNYSP